MGSEFLFMIFDFMFFALRVLLEVEILKSSILFREAFPPAGVDGATFREDFLIMSPLRASIFFF